jgi:stearoyl-CoA desaturase (delta-9 desaturase)
MSSPAAVAVLTVGVPLLGATAAIIDGIHHGIRTSDLVLLCSMYVACAFGTETGFHRLLSHRSFRARAPVRLLLCILGSMALQGPPLFWAAVHRQHHARSDREGDPHSPHGAIGQERPSFRGFAHAHVGWLFASPPGTSKAHVGDLLRDRLIVTVNRFYPLWGLLGILLPTVAGFFIVGTAEGALRACLWGGLMRVALWQQVTWSVNSFGHLFGSRPFATADQSVNNAWLAPLTLGGSWHNNHHAFPSSARVGFRAWEVDLHYAFIRALEALRVALDVKVPRADRVATARLMGRKVRNEIVTI